MTCEPRMRVHGSDVGGLLVLVGHIKLATGTLTLCVYVGCEGSCIAELIFSMSCMSLNNFSIPPRKNIKRVACFGIATDTAATGEGVEPVRRLWSGIYG